LKTVIITGGNRGIGKACAETFKSNGWNVRITSSKEDVRDFEMCKSVAKETIEKYGAINCLVNNAGVTANKPFLLMTPAEWHSVIDINLNGAFNMTKAVLFSMMKAGGSIINISSTAAIMGMVGQANYCASKAGLLGFTRALSRELARLNIRVNAVAPGLIETDMTKDKLDLTASQERIKCFVPMNKAGKPSDVAEMVYFLASDKSLYITGDIIRIDGGLGGDTG